MGRALLQWFAVAVSAVMTIVTVTQGNTVGAVFLGAGTLFLLWSVVRPGPDADSPVRPLRALAIGAAVVTVVAVVPVLVAVGRGVMVQAASRSWRPSAWSRWRACCGAWS